MTHSERQRIADDYLRQKYDLSWNDLPRYNNYDPLNDCETQMEIEKACEDKVDFAIHVMANADMERK